MFLAEVAVYSLRSPCGNSTAAMRSVSAKCLPSACHCSLNHGRGRRSGTASRSPPLDWRPAAKEGRDWPLVWGYTAIAKRSYVASWICQIALLSRSSFWGSMIFRFAAAFVSAPSWMRQYPDLKAVSRDRGGAYASAAAQGAPQATQCADRFHLLKNLGEALEDLLARHLSASRKRQVEAALEEQTPAWQETRQPRRSRTPEE